MITAWIDAVQDMWAGITAPGFDAVNAPYLIKRAEFPASIDPSQLALNPLALTIPGNVQFEYSAGGQLTGFYQGVTEFHVAPSLDRALIPSLLVWPGLIVTAAAANIKLGGLVHSFMLDGSDDQILVPVALQYGNESEHWGFIVRWTCKEVLNGQFTVGTGE